MIENILISNNTVKWKKITINKRMTYSINIFEKSGDMMGNCCSGNHFDGCGNNNRNMIIIFAAIIALILVNILDEDTTDCVGQFFQALGDLMSLTTSCGCVANLSNHYVGNNCACNYY